MRYATVCSTLTIAACFLAGLVLAQSDEKASEFPGMNDYAWGFPVLTGEEASFYSVRLPLQVNLSVTDPELRDAGVYNASGQPVPRLFQSASNDVEQIERSRSLPFVPLYANDENLDDDDIHLLFERRGDYTVLELTSNEADNVPTERALTSYIVDTRQLDEAVEALDIYWTQADSGFIGQVIVEGSDDLRNWHSAGSAAIADLNEASTSIVQRRVNITDTLSDYLRLSWTDLPGDWSAAGINAVYTLGVSVIAREQIVLPHSATDRDDGGRIFALGGAAKIDQLRVILPATNTVISADTYLWSENQQRWYRILQGTWHHIGRDSNVVASSAENITATRSSKVKVVVTHGQPDADLQLEVGWRPDTLLFLAQGPSPYILATGRAADAAANYPQHRTYGVRSITSLAAGNGQAATATLGPRYALGGEDQLQANAPVEWRQLVLWLGLLAGVAFVGFMAVRILRETGNP